MLKEWRGWPPSTASGLGKEKMQKALQRSKSGNSAVRVVMGEPVPSLHPPEAPLLAEVEFGATQGHGLKAPQTSQQVALLSVCRTVNSVKPCVC